MPDDDFIARGQLIEGYRLLLALSIEALGRHREVGFVVAIEGKLLIGAPLKPLAGEQEESQPG
jgi:hypothetical protein